LIRTVNPENSIQRKVIVDNYTTFLLGRKGEYGRRSKQGGKKYRYDDYYTIRVLMKLLANPESNRNQMKLDSESGLSTLEGGNMNVVLGKMLEADLIKDFESPHHKGQIVYSLTDEGTKFANMIKELLEKDKSHPIFNLDCFRGVKILGSSTD